MNDIAGTLSNASSTFTVFAPTDAAFIAVADGADGSMANGTVETAELDALGATALAGILTTHVVGSLAFSSDLTDGGTIPTINTNETLTVDLSSGVSIQADGSSANVIAANIVVTNGVIHKIDTILLPD